MRSLPSFALLALLSLAACKSSSTDSTQTASAGGDGAGGTTSDGGIGSSDLGGFGAGGVSAGSQQDLEVNVGDRVYFGYDSATIDQAAQQILDRQGAWLGQFGDVQVTVEGHTDERGTREYNLALGERRASAAKSYLTALGIPGDRIQATSYGEERPAETGQDEQAFQLNRRAVTSVAVTN